MRSNVLQHTGRPITSRPVCYAAPSIFARKLWRGRCFTVVGVNRCALLDARPDANIAPQQASDFVRRVMDRFDHLREALNAAAEQRGQQVLDAHRRVRAAARMTGVRYAVQPQLPPDVLGIYVLLPIPGTAKP